MTRYLGPLLLLAALVVGDQIRIHRPDHKFRLSVEVETPEGVRAASGVMSVHPDRGYTQGGTTKTKGDAVALDLGRGKTLVVLLAHEDESKFVLDDINFVAVRAFSAAGQRAAFKSMDRVKGAVPVTGKLIPLMAALSDPSNPATMKAVDPRDLAAVFGPGVRLRSLNVEIVPNGLWPIDFGGALGEPVTRGIAATLPWVKDEKAAAKAIAAAGWTLISGDDASRAFTR
jgi:hypothetical protein